MGQETMHMRPNNVLFKIKSIAFVSRDFFLLSSHFDVHYLIIRMHSFIRYMKGDHIPRSITFVYFNREPRRLVTLQVTGARKTTACSYDRPSTGEINLVPSKELLAVCIANPGVDIVVVKDRAEAWVSEDTPAKISILIVSTDGANADEKTYCPPGPYTVP
jgi:hypothetical protein